MICEREYEGPDMAHCPAYQGADLLAVLHARRALRRPVQAAGEPVGAMVGRAALAAAAAHAGRYLDTGLGHFLLLMLIIVPLLAAVFGVLYQQELRALARRRRGRRPRSRRCASGFLKAYMALLLIAGIVAWWLVLAHQSRKVAQEESNRQTHLLMREIELHRQTDRALQQAKQAADAGARARPTRPTRPRAATSAPSATSCARRSTASSATRS